VATFLLRLPDTELEALRAAAEQEHRSMNDVARRAITEFTGRGSRDDYVRDLAQRVITEDEALLKRLADR
jgi:hypothetical protein